jgi:two-component system CheB/CheR fusion protein
LIVEDDADLRADLGIYLEREGYHVVTAERGEDGVRQALAWKPQVAVIDIGLPDLDGYQVARRLRSALQDSVLLIAYTGNRHSGTHQQALEAGFDMYLVKPVDPDVLSRLIRPAGAC